MDLSVLIPARNERFLARTIQDILTNMRADTEIIAVLDGAWAEPPVEDHPRVTLIYHPESVGQRAATNEAARIASGKYLMKCDAHCAFAPGFDEVMLADMQPDWTMVPVMRNLHVFDWLCPNGHRRYQGPSGPCKECGEPTEMDVVWIAKPSPQSTAYRFDKTLHFQYWGEFKRRPEGKGDLTETLSLQGSCFLLTCEKYFELDICDENWGSWGNQGTEVALKTWLSGGRVVVNHKTWYAHMFRTQGGDFGFPYPLSGKEVERARQHSRDLFLNGKWPKAVKSLDWLINKFAPVPDWGLSRGIVYYTDNRLPVKFAKAVQKRIQRIAKDKGLPLVSASLKPMPGFGANVHLPLKRGYLAMLKQIVAALEASEVEVVYFAEHDCLYPPDHFDFIPPEKDKFYYNLNWWKVNAATGHAVRYDACQASGLVAYRELLLAEYRGIVEQVERDGFSMRSVSFEPGSRDGRTETFTSDVPYLDIRHGGNLTKSRWSAAEFRDKRTCENWQEAESVPGWGRLGDFLNV